MKIITLDNLNQVLDPMQLVFGSKLLALQHRRNINTYLVAINTAVFEDSVEEMSSAKLGTGRLGFMILGKGA